MAKINCDKYKLCVGVTFPLPGGPTITIRCPLLMVKLSVCSEAA